MTQMATEHDARRFAEAIDGIKHTDHDPEVVSGLCGLQTDLENFQENPTASRYENVRLWIVALPPSALASISPELLELFTKNNTQKEGK